MIEGLFLFAGWVGIIAIVAALAFIARLAWEIVRDFELVHVRLRRSKWVKTGERDDTAVAYGACIATARWVFGIWVRGGWRLTISRDNSNQDMPRFWNVQHAIHDAERKTWDDRQEEKDDD